MEPINKASFSIGVGAAIAAILFVALWSWRMATANAKFEETTKKVDQHEEIVKAIPLIQKDIDAIQKNFDKTSKSLEKIAERLNITLTP